MARILVVDDDEMERLLGRTILEGVGHELHFAKDGADAMRIFRTEDIDVVVTDLNMPRIDGLRLITEMREFDDRIPVVVVSAPNRINWSGPRTWVRWRHSSSRWIPRSSSMRWPTHWPELAMMRSGPDGWPSSLLGIVRDEAVGVRPDEKPSLEGRGSGVFR